MISPLDKGDNFCQMENTLQKITMEMGKIFSILQSAFRLPEDFRNLMRLLGWEVPVEFDSEVFKDLAVGTVIEKLKIILNSTPEEKEDEGLMISRVVELAASIVHVVEQLRQISGNLNTTRPNLGDFVKKTKFNEEFFPRLLDFLIIAHINRSSPATFSVLQFLTIFELKLFEADAAIYQPKHIRRKINYDRIGDLFTDPKNLMIDGYHWGLADFKGAELLQNFASLFTALGIEVNYSLMSRKVENALLSVGEEDQESNTESALAPRATISIVRPIRLFTNEEKGEVSTEVSLVAYKARPRINGDGADGGIGFFPLIKGSTHFEFHLTDLLTLVFEGELDFSTGFNLIIRPNKPLVIESGMFDGKKDVPINAKILGGLVFGKADEPSRTLFSIPGGSSINFKQVSIKVGAEKQGSGDFDPLVELDLKGLQFIICLSSADSFLQNGTGGRDLSATFDLNIGWSKHGIFFKGSAALEIAIPVNIELGPVSLSNIITALKVSNQALSLELGTTIKMELGVLEAVVKNIGLSANLAFDKPNGNLSPFDLSFGFKPPTGVGLSINTSGITGGGFLEFQENRYSGVLSLAFGEIGLAAVGLIVTEIPGGPDFALLINIGIVFSPPIQLSMGFTLNGVGGLIAVNRSIKVDALRAGIKNHTLDGILFPEPSNVIANAARIISDMEAIFPVADGQYVVGPMIKIAWAAQLFEGTVGIFIAFPDPVTIVVLGQIKGNIPDKIAPLIKINLDIIGVIDFAAQEFTFQASLYDSKILNYEIYGDSAMLIGWGDNPRFALSLGGFHPKFTPPAPAIVFADMRRLTIDISNSSAVHLVCSAYLAVTSNSLQFGAKAEMYISAGPISVDGFIQFDALFIFSPFSFKIGISAGVHLCWEGTSLLGIDLDFLLSGPTPWHAHGTASISFFFFSIDVGFDVTWGSERKAVQTHVNPWTELKKALELADNWGSVLPARRSMVEMLQPKDAKTEEQAIVLHPFGILEVRQQVCPLGGIPAEANCLSGSVFLQKIGNAPIEGYDSFNILNFFIKGDKGDSISKGEDIQEYFAPGQYWELTPDQKLSCPSFIRMKAGMKSSSVVGTKVVGNEEQVTLSYESSIFTEDNITEQIPGSRRVEWQRVSHLVEAQSARRLTQSADPLQAYSRHTKPLRIKIGSAQNKTERTVRLQKRPLVTLKHMSL